MQISAMTAAVENLPEKETGQIGGKAVLEKSPFYGLLKGVMQQLTDKNEKDGTEPAGPDNPAQGVPINTSVLCLAVPILPLQGSGETEISGAANTGVQSGDAPPGADNGTEEVPQAGIQPGLQEAELNGKLPGEAGEYTVDARTVQAADDSSGDSQGIPTGDNQNARQVKPVVQGGSTAESRDLQAGKTDGLHQETVNQHDVESIAHHSDGIEAKGKMAAETKDISRRPDGERGGPDPRPDASKPDTVRYNTGAAEFRTEAWSDTRQVFRSQRAPVQNAPPGPETDIISQVTEKMKLMLGTRKSEISIQLKPESLGRLKIRLTMTDGILNGRIVVQNDETKGLIQANIAKLQENLEQQGIPVSKFHVNVGGDGGYGRQQFFRDNRQAYQGRPGLQPYQQEEEKEYPLWRGEGTIELLA